VTHEGVNLLALLKAIVDFLVPQIGGISELAERLANS
jgi:hypothetical protein